METKTCVRCGKDKDVEKFVLDNRRDDGRASHCKQCSNEAQRKLREGTRVCKDCKQRKVIADFASKRICKECKSTKTCKVCTQRLPLTKFDGYHGLVCVDCRKKNDSARYHANKKYVLQRNRLWYIKNSYPGSEYHTRQLQQGEKRFEMRREAVFAAYGGAVCNCCGETERLFLTVDHVNGGGNAHRAEIKQNIINWLYRNNFPDGFQILCYNCNLGKQRNGGTCCPHKGIK